MKNYIIKTDKFKYKSRELKKLTLEQIIKL